MNILDFKDQLLKQGKENGFQDMEIFVQGGKSLSLKIFKENLDQYSNSKVSGVSFRGLYNGKMGYSFSENITEEAIPILLNQAKENASIIEEEEQDELYEGAESYPVLHQYNEELLHVSVEEKIKRAKEMEKAALEVSEKVKAVDYCVLNYGEGEQHIFNTKGLSLSNKENYVVAYVYARVQENQQIKTAGKHWIGRSFESLDPIKLGKEAAKEALSYLGSSSVASGEYAILLRNDVASQFLQTFVSIFFATSVQKGFSLLGGKINEFIFSEKITIKDDGLLENGMGTTPFDSEGVLTQDKIVVEKGILKTYLHNRKTAKKDNVLPTGNGFKGSYKGSVEVSATNFYIKKGKKSLEELMESLGTGLMITNLAGLHSGANTVSGDFSLAASGYYIKEGKIQRPIDQITIAGNFFEIFKDVIEVGEDLYFGMPSSLGNIGSPTLYIKKIAVSGEQS